MTADKMDKNSAGAGKRLRKGPWKHGHSGTGKSGLYQTWRAMRSRCLDPNADNFKHYGGRGITICARWADFRNFMADLGETWRRGMTLERQDTNGNYEPNNVQWIPRANQNRNKRNNTPVTCCGTTMLIPEWALESGIPAATIYKRIQRGWSHEDAVNAPVTEKFRRKERRQTHAP